MMTTRIPLEQYQRLMPGMNTPATWPQCVGQGTHHCSRSHEMKPRRHRGVTWHCSTQSKQKTLCAQPFVTSQRGNARTTAFYSPAQPAAAQTTHELSAHAPEAPSISTGSASGCEGAEPAVAGGADRDCWPPQPRESLAHSDGLRGYSKAAGNTQGVSVAFPAGFPDACYSNGDVAQARPQKGVSFTARCPVHWHQLTLHGGHVLCAMALTVGLSDGSCHRCWSRWGPLRRLSLLHAVAHVDCAACRLRRFTSTPCTG
jgi:hypothetical protein